MYDVPLSINAVTLEMRSNPSKLFVANASVARVALMYRRYNRVHMLSYTRYSIMCNLSLFMFVPFCPSASFFPFFHFPFFPFSFFLCIDFIWSWLRCTMGHTQQLWCTPNFQVYRTTNRMNCVIICILSDLMHCFSPRYYSPLHAELFGACPVTMDALFCDQSM